MAQNPFSNEYEEALISVSNISDRIKVLPYYYLHHIPGARNDCYLREGVAERLLKAISSIPSTYHMVILDGWRSFQTQQALYEAYQKAFRIKYTSEQTAAEQLIRFVAAPSKDPHHPAPHYTGGAVDLTLANENGWLNMGTDFDEFTEQARSLFYEKKKDLTLEEKKIRDNRRLLRKAMLKAGFRSNPDEWWHFDYGNALWAKENHTVVKYLGIELDVNKGRKTI
ncbi:MULTISPECIES: M15 family metallopeptidase [Heyndrickxia]|uniref:M15 family metallopeptidase n=1 Tax=Heyndrickxia TaxID=2837504 RepID=UPI002164E975|nr:M15 family metallopeptidase [Heyndrickxia coagulans]